jgi:hypothetical protein
MCKNIIIKTIIPLIFLVSCYKESTRVTISDKATIYIESITPRVRHLPLNTSSQHLIKLYLVGYYGTLSANTIQFSSSLNCKYIYRETASPKFLNNRYIFIEQTTPVNGTLLSRTDTTLVFLQGSNFYSDTLLLITTFVNPVPEDTLKLFNQCRMTLKLQEYNYGFSSSHDWSLTALKKVIYNDGKFTSFWSEGYETGNLTVQLSKLQDVALLVDYLNIYRNSIKIETDELTANSCYILNIENKAISLGYYGSDLYSKIDHRYSLSSSDTIFQGYYSSNADSYLKVELTRK